MVFVCVRECVLVIACVCICVSVCVEWRCSRGRSSPSLCLDLFVFHCLVFQLCDMSVCACVCARMCVLMCECLCVCV